VHIAVCQMEVLPMTFAVIVINRSPHSSHMTGIVHSRTATGQAYLPLLSQWLRSQQPSFGNILMMSLNRIGHAGKPQPPVHIVRMDQCPKVLYNGWLPPSKYILIIQHHHKQKNSNISSSFHFSSLYFLARFLFQRHDLSTLQQESTTFFSQ